MSLLIITLIHECIQYSKKKLYFLTFGLISRETLIKGKREEDGYIFGNSLFGWNDKSVNLKNYYNKNTVLKSKKLDIKTALKILNPNNYNNNNKIIGLKNILYNHQKEEEFGKLLNDYLKEIGLNDKSKLKEFIEENKNFTIDAIRNFKEEVYVEYVTSNHLNCTFNQKYKNNSKY